MPLSLSLSFMGTTTYMFPDAIFCVSYTYSEGQCCQGQGHNTAKFDHSKAIHFLFYKFFLKKKISWNYHHRFILYSETARIKRFGN